MNEVIENILTRRSVRGFSEKPVSVEDIEILIDAGRYAPSGANKQSWKFTAILNKELITELYTIMGKVLQREHYSFYDAPALIIPSNDRESTWGCEDNACALQNIFLAAHSMDIGSLWINQLNDICDEMEIRRFLTKIEIPENHIVYGFGAIGYSLNEPKGQIDKKSNFSIIE